MKKLLKMAFSFGRLFSPLYSALMRKRAAWYLSGVMDSVALSVPVISIGNLTLGGTGKTPMAVFVARCLLAAGYKPAIISRGYGGRAHNEVNLVSDGRDILLDAVLAGDEPRLLAELLPGVVVATGVKRAVVAEFAIKELGADIIVLDDGFQHLALRRDLDLVLFKAPIFLGSGRVFPGGELREPVDALARASGFVITGVDKNNRSAVEDFKKFLKDQFPEKSTFLAKYRLQGVIDRTGNDVTSEVSGQKLFGFCGLAEPGGFLRTVSAQGISLYGFTVFADHHPYHRDDLAQLADEAKKFGCAGLLTTEKDMVKLKELPSALPIYAMRVELVLPEAFSDLLLESLERPCPG